MVKPERASPSDRGVEGVLHLPMAICLMAIALTAASLWLVMHRWRALMELQLRLDQCTGQMAQELKSEMEALGRSNERIRALRASIAASSVAAPIAPAAVNALREALELEALHRDLRLADWKLTQAKWVIRRGCDNQRDLALPLPELAWESDPADSLGPRPLRRASQNVLQIRLSHPPRHSGARVRPGGRTGVFSSNETEWYADWHFGPDLP